MEGQRLLEKGLGLVIPLSIGLVASMDLAAFNGLSRNKRSQKNPNSRRIKDRRKPKD